MFTGYGMTRGLVDSQFARLLHLGVLGVFGLVVFVFHTAWSIHLALKRNRIWNTLTKIILFSFYFILISILFYIQFVQVDKVVLNSGIELNNVAGVGILSTKSSTANTDSSAVVFTKDTLKNYDGLSGSPAYVAIDGIVYDMSELFRRGNHYGYVAGQDLSSAFHAKHSNSYLGGYKIVGSYK